MRLLYKLRYLWLGLAGFGLLLSLILSIYTDLNGVRNVFFCIGLFFLGLFLPVTSFRKTFQREESYRKRLDSWNDISYRVKKSGEYVFADSHEGIIVFSHNEQKQIHTIEWSNPAANAMFATDTLVDKTLEHILGDNVAQLDLKDSFEIGFYGKTYHCIKTKHNILYLEDITQQKQLSQSYIAETLALGILNLDNFDQSMSKLDNQVRLTETTAIAQLIGEWGQRYAVAIQNIKDDQYLLIMNRHQLEVMAKDDFDIIDIIHNHANRQGYFMHVTIGIACEPAVSSEELLKRADDVLQNAHGKGGNQVGLYLDGQLQFKNNLLNSYENTSPTYVRLKAEELFSLINSIPADHTIYVMAHYLADTDAFGASVAAYKLISSFDKRVKIILNQSCCGETVNNIFENIKSSHQNMKHMFVDPERIKNALSPNDLVVVVDVSKDSMVMSQEILLEARNNGTKIAVIDHHRNEQINKSGYEYIYINPAGSSTVEMITEMMEYCPNDLDITAYEANLLLAGVVIDTNHYTQHMSYRTYNVLATLQKWGADTATVQAFLRDDLKETIIKNQSIVNAEYINNKYAITQTGTSAINDELLSKIADGMSMIEHIEAAFAIGVTQKGDTYQISIKARSLGYINCEALMRQLFNGGGHANQAAAGLAFEMGDNGSTVQEKIDETVQTIKQAIASLESQEEIWVILIENYRNNNGSYNKGEKIQVTEQDAKKLIASGVAVKDTIDNQKIIDDEINQENINKVRYQKRVNTTKDILLSQPIVVYVELEADGALKKRISNKVLVQNMNALLQESHRDYISIEESMIRGIDKLKGIGDATITVKLTRDDEFDCNVEIKQLLKP